MEESKKVAQIRLIASVCVTTMITFTNQRYKRESLARRVLLATIYNSYLSVEKNRSDDKNTNYMLSEKTARDKARFRRIVLVDK